MKIKTLRSLQQLDDVKDYWERWQRHPNSDFAHFTLVCRLRPEVQSPLVTVVESDGEPCALLAARLEWIRFSPRVGYFQPVRIPAKVLTVIYQGVLGQVDKEIAALLIRHVWSLLVSGEADAAVFHHLPEDSPLLKALISFGPPLFREKPLVSPNWRIDLPEQVGSLLMNMRSNHRRRTIKKQRELESTFKGRLFWKWYKHFNDINGFCARVEETAALTYHRKLSSGFRDNEEYRQRFALFAGRHQLRAQLLEIDGRIHAFWIGNIYGNVFYASETGYDPDLHEFEVGTLGLLRTIDELVREGVRKLDFGFGDADYKKRLANQCRQEATVHLFAPTLKGITLRASLGLFATLDSVGRRLMQKVGVVHRLKTLWRRRLLEANQSETDEK